MENAYKVVKKFIPKARVQTAIVLGVIGGLAGMLTRIILEKSLLNSLCIYLSEYILQVTFYR